jgi:Mg2+ and Co2+ transporter CorA
MTVAAERLAVIAAVTLPVTALSSVMGMNVIVNSSSDPTFVAILVAVMVVMASILLTWAKRHGWW